jgi:hypothetical protein
MSQPDQEQKDDKLQGEGNYDAARRYREKATDFAKHADVDKLAKQTQSRAPKDARDDALAEERARVRSKGDDPADVGIMYPHKSSDADK